MGRLVFLVLYLLFHRAGYAQEAIRIASCPSDHSVMLASGPELLLPSVELFVCPAGETHYRWHTEGKADRYGRLMGILSDPSGKDAVAILLETGMARLHPRAGERFDPSWIELEDDARAARRGLWQRFPRRKTARLWHDLGTYQIVTGIVSAVEDTKRTLRVTLDDAVTLVLPRGSSSRYDIGDRIEVRGWIENRHGPTIDVDLPTQIRTLSP
ncbi:MAG TPA: thermonuclease family protein [Dongiaceae bacterium]|nr:thermonuclease family protein [Dongiaceae bacterium]